MKVGSLVGAADAPPPPPPTTEGEANTQTEGEANTQTLAVEDLQRRMDQFEALLAQQNQLLQLLASNRG